MSADPTATRLSVASSLLQNGQTERAESIFRQILASDPAHAGASQQLAALYQKQGDFDRAIDMLQTVVDSGSATQDTLVQLANIHRSLGDFETARETYRQALAFDENSTRVHSLIAGVTRYREYDEEVRRLEEIHAATAPDSPRRRTIAFALGKAFDDLGDFDKAFRYLKEGNRIAFAEKPTSFDEMQQSYDLIKAVFDEEFFAYHEGKGTPAADPIFVTGMPRSGTTLVEQILASHPKVFGGGELGNLADIAVSLSYRTGLPFPEGFDAFDHEMFLEYGDRYIREIRALSTGEPYVTNKAVGMYVYVGLISAMLPNAKIVVCQRDPRDMGLSIFQRDMRRQDAFTNDLRGIGVTYRLFDDLLGYWDSVLPGKVYRVRYEDLVADFENNVRRMLDYCELEFDRACLEYFNTKRAVKTESHSQVRKPVYTGSVGRWRNYERHLRPLIDALNN